MEFNTPAPYTPLHHETQIMMMFSYLISFVQCAQWPTHSNTQTLNHQLADENNRSIIISCGMQPSILKQQLGHMVTHERERESYTVLLAHVHSHMACHCKRLTHRHRTRGKNRYLHDTLTGQSYVHNAIRLLKLLLFLFIFETIVVVADRCFHI